VDDRSQFPPSLDFELRARQAAPANGGAKRTVPKIGAGYFDRVAWLAMSSPEQTATTPLATREDRRELPGHG